MQTTQEQIQQRLCLLLETMLEEVLLLINFLLSRPKISTAPAEKPEPNFVQPLTQVETEGGDIEEIDFFAGVRDRPPAPEAAKW